MFQDINVRFCDGKAVVGKALRKLHKGGCCLMSRSELINQTNRADSSMRNWPHALR